MGRWSPAVAAFCMIALLSSVAGASVNSEGQLGLVRTFSARTHEKLKLNMLLGVAYATGSDFVAGVNGQPLPTTTQGLAISEAQKKNAQMLSVNYSIGMGLTDFWDIALSLPFYYDYPGFDNQKAAGLGDLVVSTKVRTPGLGDVFFIGLYAGGTIPVGVDGGWLPRNSYYDDSNDTATAEFFYSYKNPTVKAILLWTLDFGEGSRKVPVALHLNTGAFLTPGVNRHSLLGGFGLEASPAQFVTLFADFSSEIRFTTITNRTDIWRDRFFISPGIRINTPAGVYLYACADLGLSALAGNGRIDWSNTPYNYSTTAAPKLGVQFALGWTSFLTAQDDDKDGIKNDDDRCPKDAEDVDGFEDSDGCPDLDNDSDGIPDLKDKCPNKAEDTDGFEDTDGCPDPDNDGDGIVDIKDQCPTTAEDFDGFEDKDGCPDLDNDKDGVADSLDRCPNDPEDPDNYQDDDGCPDIDNDKDGIPDLKDQCPNEPENFNGKDDQDGCPDTVTKVPKSNMPKHQVLFGVHFKSGKAEMTFDSYRFLEPIVAELKKYPDIEVEIRGHTDSIGSYSSNMRLSQKRAESVRQYLLSQGVNGERMRAIGFGPSSPIADNRTAAGRGKNRRIEIVRIK